MKLYFMLGLILLTGRNFCQDQWKDVYKESAWTERDQWQKADEILRHMNLRSGSKVADIGCHEGYMSFKLSKVVGKEGKVYAVDVKQDKLDKLLEHATTRKVENIITVKGDYDNPKLPVNALNAVIIIDAYHEMKEPNIILGHIKNSLKPGGRLVLCEPLAEERKNLSREDQERKHELGIKYALGDLRKAGFNIIKSQNTFIDRQQKGDMMWLIVAERR